MSQLNLCHFAIDFLIFTKESWLKYQILLSIKTLPALYIGICYRMLRYTVSGLLGIHIKSKLQLAQNF